MNDKLINAKSLAENYCKKMCVGNCSGTETEKCAFIKLLNDEPEVHAVEITYGGLED